MLSAPFNSRGVSGSRRAGCLGAAGRFAVPVALGAAGLLLASPLFAQDAARGEQFFERLDCARCHGQNAQGDVGPGIAGTRLSLDEVRAQLRNPRNQMPAFRESRLSDDAVADIYAFLQALPIEPQFPTWFATDLINLPTPMMPGERTLEVHFSHRFSQSIEDAGREGLWGLDSFAFPAFWFAYGVNDWLQAHGGRSSNLGTWEYGAKVELLAEDRLSLPISAAALVSGSYVDRQGIAKKNRFTAEFPVGWRAHERVSLVAVPFVATNTDETGQAEDDYSAAVGLGGTIRITTRQSIDVEWVTNIVGFERDDAVDQWQVFWGVKIGGHVVQVGVTNAVLYTPDQMAPGAQETGQKSDVRLGFNLVRAFVF